jgi:hypothetical protein
MMQGLVEVPGDVFGTFHHCGIFCDAARHWHDLAFLVAQLTQARYRGGGEAGGALDLARDDDHRHRIGPGTEHPVEGIDAARAGGHVQHRWMVGNPRIGFRRHRRGLLMMEADCVEAGLMGEGVVEEHGTAAGDHEYMLRAMRRQALRKVGGYRRHGKVGAGTTAISARFSVYCASTRRK